MNDRRAVLLSAVAALLATAARQPAQASDTKFEKCYGIVKAGQNDCATSTHSCAGQSKQDGDPESWLYVPQGICDRILGGSTEPRPKKS